MINKVASFFRAVWQLALYLTVGLAFTPVILSTATLITTYRWAYLLWLWFDRIVCTIVHFTWKRTISGLTGERALTMARYRYQAIVIDWLAELVGDKPNHCYRAYLWEKRKGFCKDK